MCFILLIVGELVGLVESTFGILVLNVGPVVEDWVLLFGHENVVPSTKTNRQVL